MWSEKYRPKSVSEMVGNEAARMALLSWLKGWKPGSKAALLVGPPGTGKTTLVTLLSSERGMNLVELNASDARTKEKLKNKMGEAMSSVSLFGERSLIFLDEVDGLAGRSDYGAVEFIKTSIKESQNPIVMAANDPDSDEVRKLSSSSLLLQFKPPPPREVEMYLRRIVKSEGMHVREEEVRRIVSDSSGDIRQAVNSLQSRALIGSTSYKDREPSLGESLNAFFEARDPAEAASALRKVPLSPLEKVREIHRSVVKSDLPGERRATALETLSRADLLMAKMQRAGNWRLLRYLDALLSRELQPLIRGDVRYSQEDLPFPVLLRIWNDSKKVKEVSVLYAAQAHTGSMSARSQDMPYVFRLCSSKEFRERLESALDLDETFDKFLTKEASR